MNLCTRSTRSIILRFLHRWKLNGGWKTLKWKVDFRNGFSLWESSTMGIRSTYAKYFVSMLGGTYSEHRGPKIDPFYDMKLAHFRLCHGFVVKYMVWVRIFLVHQLTHHLPIPKWYDTSKSDQKWLQGNQISEATLVSPPPPTLI